MLIKRSSYLIKNVMTMISNIRSFSFAEVFIFIALIMYPVCLSLSNIVGFLRPVGFYTYSLGVVLLMLFLFTNKQCTILKINKSLATYCIFYCFSLFLYGLSTDNISWIFKDFLYCVFPALSFFFYSTYRKNIQYRSILWLILLGIIIIDSIALVIYFVPSTAYLFLSQSAEDDFIFFKLSGPFGLIVTGYTNIIALSICLLSELINKRWVKYILSALFILCALLTTQRTPLAGLGIVVLVLCMKQKVKSIIPLLFVGLFFIIALNYIGGIVDLENVTSTFEGKLDAQNMAESRSSQQIITNNSNIISMIIGEGAGKYSPDNPFCDNSQPDAMYFRLFNELGFLGFIAYILFALSIILKAYKMRNYLALAVALYSFFATGFNRVMFVSPFSIISFVIFSFLYRKQQCDVC